jgi:hypothetical protein
MHGFNNLGHAAPPFDAQRQAKGEWDMEQKLQSLLARLKAEQRQLLYAAAEMATMPSASTLQMVARLELNIAAIENTLADDQR